MLTSKQSRINRIIKRFGKTDGISAFDIGVIADQPRKKAESWAKPAVKELIKQKLVSRGKNNKFFPVLIEG